MKKDIRKKRHNPNNNFAITAKLRFINYKIKDVLQLSINIKR